MTTTIRRLDRRTPVSPTALRPGNRAYLRALRAAEAAAWEAAPIRRPRSETPPPPSLSGIRLRARGRAGCPQPAASGAVGTPRPTLAVKGGAAWPQADTGALGTLRPANVRGNRPAAPASGSVRLPSATTDDQAEGRWHALLSLIAIGSVGFALWTSGALARHWSEVTAAVQRLVGIS